MSDPEFKTVMLKSQAEQLKMLGEMRDEISLLNTAVLGNEKAKIPGLATRVEVSEKYIEKDKAFKRYVAGALVVISFFGVTAWEFIKEWAKRHFFIS